MNKREVLRPYKKQRLSFEGVLIHVIPPDRKNNYLHGLVFASLYAPNEQIELDHAVIEMDRQGFAQSKLELFKRYQFTAKVSTYHKPGPIMGISVQQECFMLQQINAKKITQIETSRLTQPTEYIRTRMNNVLLSKNTQAIVRYTEEQLMDLVTSMPNDGTVEEFMNVYTRSHQIAKVNAHDIVRAVYQ